MNELNYNEVIQTLFSGPYIRVTKYMSPKLIIRATRRRFDKEISLKGKQDVVLTVGTPNYLEREFIKILKKAKEPFPVKQVQLKHYNPPKKNPVRK